jgi:hypothetical protein
MVHKVAQEIHAERLHRADTDEFGKQRGGWRVPLDAVLAPGNAKLKCGL